MLAIKIWKGRILPWDFIRYNILLRDDKELNTFIKMISHIYDKNGFYFNKNFIHSRLLIEECTVIANLAEKLYPHLELLKNTEVIECTIKIP